jgi:prepilin-type N-terminal cleavage/methylation domain-containing protein
MLSRLRPASEDRSDKGFTLIELLVVMIIIGILAAIAIPVFLNQRQRAVDSSLKSDVRTVANEMETRFVDNQTYPASAAAATGPLGLTLSNGNQVQIIRRADGQSFCLIGSRTAGVQAASQDWYYDSTTGGLLDADTTPTVGEGTACA